MLKRLHMNISEKMDIALKRLSKRYSVPKSQIVKNAIFHYLNSKQFQKDMSFNK